MYGPLTRGMAWRLVATALGALLGVQCPLPWGGLLGALLAALLVEQLVGRRLGAWSGGRALARCAIGCVVGTSLVPALANPVLLPTGLLAACWFGGAALIARLGRVDLGTALASPSAGSRSGFWRHLVFALEQARGLSVLLLAAWLTQ